MLLGQEAIDRGDLEAAVGWFETAVAIKPDLSPAHFCMGVCLDELDRLVQAAQAHRHARELEPRDPITRYQLASVLARRDRPSEAIDEVRTLVKENPGIADQLREDPDFDRLGDHPRFLALVGDL